MSDTKYRCVAIIPARGGSKGIPQKNLVKLHRRPLLAYTIEAARQSGLFEKVLVSTENEKIRQTAHRYGAQSICRPANLSGDRAATEPVVLHALNRLRKTERYRPDVVFLLQATSPLRDEDDIRAAYRQFLRQKVDSLLSVEKNTDFLWKESRRGLAPINYSYSRRPRRQDMPVQFKENGAIYITKYEIWMRHGNRLGGRIGYSLMDPMNSIEIDVPFDVIVAAAAVRRRGKIRKKKGGSHDR
ncbi:MAG: NTP transferase domain-containing protein [Candidatus Omnitrophica bacterium]|nr:NTP transferase domain-containing protein [Candidatus Omnitrophota bacterium]